MKTLVLAEKPSVAKELARVLNATNKQQHYYEGPDYLVTWALGHLLTLKMPEAYKPEWKTWALETLPMMPTKLQTEPLPKTRPQLKAIKQLANRKEISAAVIATDAGREGELVARYILNYVQFKKPIKRLWISSQTDGAIKSGFKQLKPSQDYDDLYAAALARAEADWLIGLNVSRALTVKYDDSLSAGRVQTPTLAFVADQEAKINRFVPQKYAVLAIESSFGPLELAQQNLTKDAAEKLAAQVKKANYTVVNVSEQKKETKAPLLYDLTELQQVANAKYGFSAKQTLNILQTLYEQYKLVSYPRTDSKYLTSDLASTMGERISAISGEFKAARDLGQNPVVKQKHIFNNAKVSDHYGLIPTEERGRVSNLDSQERKIYDLIVKRFLGLFYPNSVQVKRSYELTSEDNAPKLSLKQTDLIEPGFKFEAPTKQAQPKIGQHVKLTVSVVEKLSQPPKPLNEGALLGQMEKFGLGTPATRAEIIERLIKGELLTREHNQLQVTPKGQQLLKLVNPDLVSPNLTAKWETELQKIEQGKLPRDKFIQGIKTDTKRLVAEIKTSDVSYRDFNLTNKKCPECGNLLKEKMTKTGKILVCTNPECRYTRRKDPKVSNHRCSQCHKKMAILSGEKGDYFKCLNCGNTEKMSEAKGKKKVNKAEERRLLKKYQAAEPAGESALALALKAAMSEQD